jgi:hypothetical protein
MRLARLALLATAACATQLRSMRMRAELEARLADLDDPFIGHEDFIQL